MRVSLRVKWEEKKENKKSIEVVFDTNILQQRPHVSLIYAIRDIVSLHFDSLFIYTNKYNVKKERKSSIVMLCVAME